MNKKSESVQLCKNSSENLDNSQKWKLKSLLMKHQQTRTIVQRHWMYQFGPAPHYHGKGTVGITETTEGAISKKEKRNWCWDSRYYWTFIWTTVFTNRVSKKLKTSKRLCVDYRKLNKVASKDSSSPVDRGHTRCLGMVKVVTNSRYKEWLLASECGRVWWTKDNFLLARRRLVTIQRKSFGLCNVPAVFERLIIMERVLYCPSWKTSCVP